MCRCVVHICMQWCVCVCVCVCVCWRTSYAAPGLLTDLDWYQHTHTQTHRHTDKNTHTHTHTYIHTYIHKYIHKYIHILIYIIYVGCVLANVAPAGRLRKFSGEEKRKRKIKKKRKCRTCWQT